ncbi:Uncharacterized protein dnm_026820 [Desulfonema magnum]|uniref:Uncharacterized protein n=1 Tax=Desulfonema magnum TaxID=45655 RepID=A0A975BK95_9BACT|nr:Uncharacterized protein dnm_026820 [Desulfonema magnum]
MKNFKRYFPFIIIMLNKTSRSNSFLFQMALSGVRKWSEAEFSQFR